MIKIAWRNIWRNKYRSLITIAGVGLGLAALIFIRAFIDGGDAQMVENYTDLYSGHIQIHSNGFQKKMSLDLSISDPAALEKKISSVPGVVAVSQRVKDYALISSADSSAGVLLIGLDPVKEPELTRLNTKVRKGSFLTSTSHADVVIGKDLADNLNVNLNSKVVIMSQGSDGSMVAASYKVCGILETGAEELDRSIALITLSAAQDLLTLNTKVSELAVRVNSIYNIDAVASELNHRFGPDNLEILSWKEISPITKQWLEFDRAFSNVILFIVLIVVAASILNTMLMSVLERTREFGVMLALGTRPAQIVGMVALESFFLGVIGTGFGAGIGLGLARYFEKNGIDLTAFSDALEAYYTGSVIHPRIFMNYVALWAAIVLATCIVASIYPAFKASRLKPMEALR